MPIRECIIDGQTGFKWGNHGKCYVGKSGRAKAQAQGVAAIIGGEKLSVLKVSFDYDETITTSPIQEKAIELIKSGNDVYIISARHDKDKMIALADRLGIPHSRVYAMGSNESKLQKISDLKIDIHYDNNPDIIKSLKGTNTKGIKV